MPENDIRMLIRLVHTVARLQRRTTHEGGTAVAGSAARTTLYRACRSRAVSVLLLVATLLVSWSSHAMVLGEVWSSHLKSGAVDATVGDLDGDGVLDVIVAAPDSLTIFTWNTDEDRYQPIMNVEGFAAPISAVATADITGNGRDDIWVGLRGSGSIQRYSFNGEGLTGHGTVTRLWNSVSQLRAVDIDADGRSDLIALGEDGVAILLHNTPGGFEQVWRTPAGEGADRFITIGQYTASGLPAIVIGKAQGQVSIYQWESETDLAGQTTGTLVRAFENYPWGIIGSVDLVPNSATGRSDLYITTSQNLLYRYSWDGTGSRHAAQWPQYIVNTTTHLQALRIPEVPTLWVGLEGQQLAAWDRTSRGLEQVWKLPDTLEWITQTETGHLITFASDGRIRLLGGVPDTYLRVQRDDKGFSLEHPALVDNDELFLAASDMARILSLRGWSSRGGTRFTGVASWFQFFIIDAGSDTASINGRRRTLSAPARVHEDVLYLPISFAEALGFEYEWVRPIRSLTIR